MEAITNKVLNNKKFMLRAAFGQCTDEGHQRHLYRYRFLPEDQKEFEKVCHEKNITIVELLEKDREYRPFPNKQEASYE